MPSKDWQDIYDRGCEWCGTKLASLHEKNAWGYTTRGLQVAHIFARKYAPDQKWNSFILCPNCHAIFDRIVKPRLQKAIETALHGFADPPNSQRRFVVAQTYEDLVERLITRDTAPRQQHLEDAQNYPNGMSAPKKPNQAMQLTTGRSSTSRIVTSTLPLQSKLALASGS